MRPRYECDTGAAAAGEGEGSKNTGHVEFSLTASKFSVAILFIRLRSEYD